jgi:4-amino-4-deoxy-L-arabinose transferase-like glycosyltransferase
MIFVALLVLILLLPFIGKAFHIDDPLFIWVAQHIQTNPGNPYGFLVNWYGTDMPMSAVNKNPPLVSYYIALAASVLGWSEPALHLAFLLPALAVALGMYLVARRFCERPLLATLAGLLTPVFFVTSMTVMSDMLMLAFWVFAVYFWIRGMETRKHGTLAFAGLLIGVAALTKYFAVVLIPLLGFYSMIKERRVGWSLLYLLLPIALLGWYQWTTHQLYGRGLLLDAAAYATNMKPWYDKARPIPQLYIALVFTGGCIASALFLARQLWSSTALALGVLVAGLSVVVLASFPTLGAVPLAGTTHWLLALQIGIWGTVGVSLLLVAVLDLHRQRDADSLFLFVWMIGTFVFAGFVNWTTNGRSILPMIVPAGILIARLLERRVASRRPGRLPATLIPLAAAAALSLAVTWADAGFAETGRTGARMIHDKHAASSNAVWFQGHWGFQYYMQQLGAKAVDVRNFRVAPGDIVAVPTTNTNLYGMAPQWAAVEVVDVPMHGWLATMNPGVGAGFYADVFGPLPFAVGSIPMERFRIFSASSPARAASGRGR